MRKILKIIYSTFFTAAISGVVYSSVFAQVGGPPSPPIDITVVIDSIPQVDNELEVKIQVTPEENMHAEISCILPEGIEPVLKQGIMIRPYIDRRFNYNEPRIDYRKEIVFWTGLLEEIVTKEFSFQVIIRNEKKYEQIIQVLALKKWGVKEKIFVIDTK